MPHRDERLGSTYGGKSSEIASVFKAREEFVCVAKCGVECAVVNSAHYKRIYPLLPSSFSFSVFKQFASSACLVSFYWIGPASGGTSAGRCGSPQGHNRTARPLRTSGRSQGDRHTRKGAVYCAHSTADPHGVGG